MKRSQLLSCVIMVVGLALGTSASGASGFSPHQALAAPLLDEPQLFVTDRVAGMALAGTTLYWHTSCGDEFSPPHSRLRSKPTNSSADSYSTLYYRECPAAAADRVSSANVALDGTYAYWLAGDGRVLRLPRSASGDDTPTQLSRTVQRAGVGGFPSCCAIAVDNDYIFWNEDKKVYRVAKSGGTGTLIYDGATDDPSPGTRLHDLRAGGDGSVYLLLGNRLTVLRPAVAGYTRRVIGTSSTVTTAYALDNSRIYWAATTGARYVVMSQARDFTGLRTHYTYSGPGALSVDNLAVDATNIYWHDHGSRSGRIYRLARGEGATPVALTADLLIGSPLLADGQYLFWTDYNTGIYRLQVNAAPVAPANGDIWITGMEVTQAIQTSDNRIPLVGNKVTVVRVYVRSREDSNGRWNGVRARLDVSGSSRTHSSRGIDIPAAGSNRRTLDDSFYFLLHREETAPDVPGRPGRDLTATIFPPLGRPEADTSNNTLTIHVNFGPSRSLTVWGYTYANINNGPECTGGGYGANGYTPPFANFEAHRQYAENAYPLSTLNLLPLSGSGTHSYDNRDCGAYLRAHDGAVALFDMNWPMGAVRGLVMQPDNERLAGWCCNSSRGNQIMRFQDFRPLPGVSVAHELSHSFGGVFGNCHTFDPCMRYPRPDPRPIPPATLPPNAGSIGPEVGLRLYPTPHAVPGEDPRGATTTWDIMSYHPGANWVSPYTYCKLLNYMSRGSVLCPSTVEGGGVESGGMLSTHIGDFSTFTAAGAQSSSDNGGIRLDPAGQPLTFLYIAGAIDDAGKASFRPFQQIASTDNLTSKTEGKSYSVSLEDGNGKMLSSYGFDVVAHHEDGEHETTTRGRDPYRFSAYLPWDPATARIVLRAGDNVLAEREVSANPPSVSLAAPTGGEVLSGKQTLSWQASDPDNDELTYSVWYSHDAGGRWFPLAVNLQETSTTVNFDQLAGSKSALVRVLASDGVNTTEARSTETFSVPRKAPQVTLSAPEEGTILIEGQEFLARGLAFDPEDGAVDDPAAFSWSDEQGNSLGNGDWTVLQLKSGAHTLTLSAKDSEGNVTTASVRVTVLPAQPSVIASRHFPETGKTIKGRFMEYWDTHGGLAQQGYPISEEFTEQSTVDGKTYRVQYFERAVFEYHPENKPPYDVLLSLLGAFRYKEKYPDGAPKQTPNSSPGSVLFRETGHRLGGVFLDYWNKNGGLAQQGYPISDEFVEQSELDGKPYTVQYFERAVFEYHPENKPPYDVLLSQLGTFRFKEKYSGAP